MNRRSQDRMDFTPYIVCKLCNSTVIQNREDLSLMDPTSIDVAVVVCQHCGNRIPTLPQPEVDRRNQC